MIVPQTKNQSIYYLTRTGTDFGLNPEICQEALVSLGDLTLN